MNNLQNLWRKSTTPHAPAEDEARREYMAKVILTIVNAVALVAVSLAVIGWAAGVFSPDIPAEIALITACLFGVWWLAYRGYWRLGSYILLILLFLEAIYTNWVEGPGTSAILYYTLTILLTAILYGVKAQWGVLGLSLGAYLAVGWAHAYGHLPPPPVPRTEFPIWALNISVSLIIITLVQWFSTGQLQRALAQSRAYAAKLAQEITERKRAEDALRRAHDELELRVAERTEELSELNALLQQDIIARQQVEEELRRAKEAALEAQHAAEVASQAKSAFLAHMSHELRTPLNAILGFTQLIMRSQDLAPKHYQDLSIIKDGGEHLLTLINNILDMSKIEVGLTTLNKQNFDLYQLLDDLEYMFQLQASNKQLQLVLNRASDVPQYVRADEDKLRQVLTNLLDNALKFTEEGRVTMRVAVDRETAGSPYLHFEVEDAGPGIAPDELDSLSEPFAQTKTGRERGGVGLGLAISQEFVRLMGGQITISRPCSSNLPPAVQRGKAVAFPEIKRQSGPGTVFKFDIQINVVEATDIEAQAAPHHAHRPKQIITEADSQLELSPTVLATLPATWLAKLDYAACLADGDMALELVGQLEAEHASLARVLTTMVHNFQFDRLVNLTTTAQDDKI